MRVDSFHSSKVFSSLPFCGSSENNGKFQEPNMLCQSLVPMKEKENKVQINKNFNQFYSLALATTTLAPT
jgi:hypothetical protein